MYTSDSLASLVKEDRVHSRIFVDPEIFELEMKLVFKRTWLYALHESEIPNPGDFKLVTLASTPLIAVRTGTGSIRVLVNRCRHRGAQVCEIEYGNTRYFRCWYHGWTYASDGSLVGTGEDSGCDGAIAECKSGLTALPKVDSYRGFIFVSFSDAVPELREYLGQASSYIDIVADYSPTGNVQLRPDVVHKTKFRGNWKQVGMDGYHVDYVHSSVVDLFAERETTVGSAVGALEVDNPWSDESRSRAVGMPFGHAALDLSEQRLPLANKYIEELNKSTDGRDFLGKLEALHGEDRARELIALQGDPHLGVFPNLQIIHDHLRVIIPISADETHVYMYPIFLEGVPDSINSKRLRHHEDFYGPAGFGSPDDFAIFERTQKGLTAQINPWVMLRRGLEREEEVGGISRGRISDEVTQRAQMKEWRRLMSESTANMEPRGGNKCNTK